MREYVHVSVVDIMLIRALKDIQMYPKRELKMELKEPLRAKAKSGVSIEH